MLVLLPKTHLPLGRLLALLLAAFIASPVLAVDIFVNTNADNLIAGDGDCTLREALRNANNDGDFSGGDCAAGSGVDTIFIPADTYPMMTLGGDDSGLVGDYDIIDDVNLIGDGAATTVISGVGVERVFELEESHVVTVHMSGLTIRDGETGSAPGAGIEVNQSTLTMANCTLTNNDSGGLGGAIAVGSGSCSLVDCTIALNASTDRGAGIYVTGGSCTLERCSVTGNQASNAGGGIYMTLGQLTLIDTVISGNHSTSLGGGIRALGGMTIVQDCRILDNASDTNGGGAYCSDTRFVNCFFSGNTAARGAGASVTTGAFFTNCSFSGNVATTDGGAIRSTQPDTIVWNSILHGNTPNEIEGAFTLSSSNIQGGLPAGSNGTDNINAAPFFVDAANNDLRLQPSSPGIDQGSCAALHLAMRDIDGGPRVLGTSVDMGAHETAGNPPTIYVDAACGDDSWLGINPVCQAPDGPKATIQAGIDACFEGGVVFVADGVYSGPGNVNLNFWGKNLTVQSVSDDPLLCVIDCQSTPETHAFNFYNGETSASVVRGLTMQNGSMTGAAGSGDRGAGIHFAFDSNPTIENCIFRDNDATLGGALLSFAASPTIVNCLFHDNSAANGGGALNAFGGGSPTMINCTVVENSSVTPGGAIATFDATPTLANTILWGNTPDEIGSFGGAVVTLDYCAVAGGWAGAGSANIDQDPLFVDAAFGDWRLLPRSPCIDAGNLLLTAGTSDLDRLPRIFGGQVDLGAYESVGGFFDRGDCNVDGSYNIADPVLLLGILFNSGGPASCDDACDANDDGSLNIADAVYMLSSQFQGGSLPPDPHGSCGLDPTGDALTCNDFPTCSGGGVGPVPLPDTTPVTPCAPVASADVFDLERARILARLSSEVYYTQSVGGMIWPGWQVEDTYLDPTDNTYFVIARQLATGHLAVIFRGTEASSVANILTNANALPNPSGIHSGFADAYSQVALILQVALANLATTPSAHVYFTGHSLGGALATVASYYLADSLVSQGYFRSNVIMYSFGAPRSFTTSASNYESKVPHSYAIANLDDPVPLVPAGSGYIHIDEMIVNLVGGHVRQTRDGATYGLEIPSNPLSHGTGTYIWRLGTTTSPDISLSIGGNGTFRLNWDFPDREDAFKGDYVALYHGFPTDPDDYLPIFGTAGACGTTLPLFAWEYADAGSSYTTSYAKGNGFYIAYIEQESLLTPATIIKTWGPYVPATPNVWGSHYSGILCYYNQLNWSVSDAGRWDFVALYDGNPFNQSANNYYTNQWDCALSGSSHVTDFCIGSGYWVGYVMEDDWGNLTVLDAAPIP